MRKFVFLLALLSGFASAAPSITSVTPSGGGLTIVGTGFGSKTTAAPFFWQDYTSGTTATDFGYSANQQAYGSGSATSTLSASSADARVSGKKAMLWDMVMNGVPVGDSANDDRDYFPHLVVRSSNTGAGSLASDDLYAAYWFKLVRVSGANSNDIQLKGPRSGSGTDSVDNYGSYQRYVPHLWLAGDTSYKYVYQEAVSNTGITSTGEHYNFATAPPWNTGGWNFLEVRMHLNSLGVADGYMEWWVNGHSLAVNSDSTSHPSYDQIRVRESGDSAVKFNFSAIAMGIDFNHMTVADSHYQAIFSEQFLDATLQHVIVTDNATYSSSTEFDVQYPTAWSSTGATIGTLNQGNLAAGSTAYVFVCDAAGACNSTGASFTVPGASNTMAANITDTDTLTANLKIGVSLATAANDSGVVAANLQTGSLLGAAIVDVGVMTASLTNGAQLSAAISNTDHLTSVLANSSASTRNRKRRFGFRSGIGL